MFVQIAEILKQPGLSRRFTYKGPVDLVQVDCPGDIEIDVKITNAQSRVLVDGVIRAAVNLECCRCLEVYSQNMEIEVHEEFLPKDSPELSNEDIEWDRLSVFSFEDDRIDMYEVIRQSILAGIPLKPLCREDCPGIDSPSYLGLEDENADKLGDVDPRLMPLMEIKNKLLEK